MERDSREWIEFEELDYEKLDELEEVISPGIGTAFCCNE